MPMRKPNTVTEYKGGYKVIELKCSDCRCQLSMGRIIKHKLYCLKCSDIRLGLRDKKTGRLLETNDNDISTHQIQK